MAVMEASMEVVEFWMEVVEASMEVLDASIKLVVEAFIEMVDISEILEASVEA